MRTRTEYYSCLVASMRKANNLFMDMTSIHKITPELLIDFGVAVGTANACVTGLKEFYPHEKRTINSGCSRPANASGKIGRQETDAEKAARKTC